MLPKNGKNNCRQREFIIDVSQKAFFYQKFLYARGASLWGWAMIDINKPHLCI
jgi:hypothetical protein